MSDTDKGGRQRNLFTMSSGVFRKHADPKPSSGGEESGGQLPVEHSDGTDIAELPSKRPIKTIAASMRGAFEDVSAGMSRIAGKHHQTSQAVKPQGQEEKDEEGETGSNDAPRPKSTLSRFAGTFNAALQSLAPIASRMGVSRTGTGPRFGPGELGGIIDDEIDNGGMRLPSAFSIYCYLARVGNALISPSFDPIVQKRYPWRARQCRRRAPPQGP
jgi:hypothetical protein